MKHETTPQLTASHDPVTSPFSEMQALVRSEPGSGKRTAFWIATSLVIIGVLFVGGYILYGQLNDPLRVMQPFPVGKYMDNHRALAGSRFRAELRVEADLGWKEGAGKLMLFSMGNDSRPIAILIPQGVAEGAYFSKNQNYLAQLEVKEGGLIYAHSIRKQ